MIALEEKGLQYESKRIEFSSSRLVPSCDQLFPQTSVLCKFLTKAMLPYPLSDQS